MHRHAHALTYAYAHVDAGSGCICCRILCLFGVVLWGACGRILCQPACLLCLGQGFYGCGIRVRIRTLMRLCMYDNMNIHKY